MNRRLPLTNRSRLFHALALPILRLGCPLLVLASPLSGAERPASVPAEPREFALEPARPVTNANAPTSAVTSLAKPPAPAVAPPRAGAGKPTVASLPAAKFPPAFASLDYSPVTKPEFTNNPRREVKGLYVTLYSAGSSTALERILKVVDETALNALVIDVKDDTGRMLHRSEAAAQHNPKANQGAPVADLAAFAKRLRDRRVYAIARIVTFKDPIYAETHPQRAIIVRRTGKLFRSQDGLAWGSPYDPDYRAYNLAVAKEAARAGFNEIQFDYIRFPEIRDDATVDYRSRNGQSKAHAIQSFLIEARRQLAPLQVYLSADVFGLVCVARDDMRIGQYWEAISNVMDYISPMAYPSHYAPGSYGLAAPDLHPYEVLSRATQDSLRRNRNIPTPARVRPWIQAFTAKWLPKYQPYGIPEIKAQIRALEDQGVRSYLVWNPGNRYAWQTEAFK